MKHGKTRAVFEPVKISGKPVKGEASVPNSWEVPPLPEPVMVEPVEP